MDADRFYVGDVRAAKICMSAARGYFSARGWDWTDFLAHGRPVADLIAQGDHHAMLVVEVVKGRSA